jgi:hypothetical protein
MSLFMFENPFKINNFSLKMVAVEHQFLKIDVRNLATFT